MRSVTLAAALGCLLWLGACGDPEPAEPGRAAGPEPKRPRAVAPVEPVALPERARFALERILRGPEKSAAVLRVPRLHATNLAMAERDLVDMAPHTLALLEDDALIARLTAKDGQDPNRWLGVLSVLMAIPQKPADLVIRWTAPALERPADIPLLRRGVRTITTVQDASTAPTILRYLEAAPGDRIVGPKAFRSLETFGSPWREQAVRVALEHGGPFLWGRLAGMLSLQRERTVVDPTQGTALAWASHWLEGSGPRTSRGLPREKKHAWSGLRIWVDPLVRRTTRAGEGGAEWRVLTHGIAPLETAYGTGWFTCDTADAGFVPSSTLFLTGRTAAAEARCTLASRGHAPFIASRDAEDTEAFKAVDRAVYYTAHHCVDADTEGPRREENLETFLERLEAAKAGGEDAPLPPEMTRLMGGLPDPEADPRVKAALEEVLFEFRPGAPWRTVLYAAHDRLVPGPPPTDEELARMRRLALQGSAEDRGVAIDIIRRLRYPAYIGILEEVLDQGVAKDPVMLWRTLMLAYATSAGVEPQKLLAFAERAEGWIRDTFAAPGDHARAAALAVGLLDFGDAGAAAFARFLRGPGRPAYVAALAGRKTLLPPAVIEALLAPLRAQADEAELRMVMGLAWRLFPASAAASLSALAQDVGEAQRPLVEAALVRVRHRGPRAAR